ncbi:Hypothetical protein POVR1_LOCUS107 [uncultured virus]|nr:Hypothetical protein POVR1_LOCUS107 [uncultured virus]
MEKGDEVRQMVLYQSVNDPTNRILFEQDDGSILVRSFEDSKPSTIVMVAYFDGIMISDRCLYELIACKHHRDQTEKENQSIASVRWLKKYKGVPGGSFKNTVTVDIWLNGEKAHTKVTKKKIQICGVKSPEVGHELAAIVLDHILEVQSYIEWVRSDRLMFVESIQWLICHCYGEAKSIYVTEQIEAPNKKTFTYGRTTCDYVLKYPPIKDIPEDYREHIIDFMNRSTDLLYHYQLVGRANLFLNDEDIITPDFDVIAVTFSMINHNYHLGFIPNRYKLVEKLKELGYNADFANAAKSVVVVKVCSKAPCDTTKITRKIESTMSVQTFTFYPRGSLLQSGCDIDAMRSCYCRLILDIVKIKKEIEITPKRKQVKR